MKLMIYFITYKQIFELYSISIFYKLENGKSSHKRWFLSLYDNFFDFQQF